MAKDPSLAVGALVGPYRIERALGAGTDDLAYRASDGQSGRPLLKEFYAPSLMIRAADGVTVEPLDEEERPVIEAAQAEIRALAVAWRGFAHPQVVTVLGAIDAHGTTYLVLDQPEGRTLGQLIGPEEALAPEELEEVLPGAVAALAAVHAAGIPHLDMSPASLLVRRDGTAMLTRGRLLSSRVVPFDRVYTTDPADVFRAPEQLAGDRRAGRAADLYGLAATLLRLISGQVPPHAISRMMAIQRGEPDPAEALLSQVDRAWSARLLNFIRGGLALEPKQRPALETLTPLAGRTGPTRAVGAPTAAELKSAPKTAALDAPPAPPPPRPALEAPTVRVERAPPQAAPPVSGRPPQPPARAMLDTPTVRAPPPALSSFSEAPTVRIRRPTAPEPPPPPKPAAPKSFSEQPTVIYRRGKPEAVAGAPGPAAEEPAPARFAAFVPRRLATRQWSEFNVYLHEPGIDSVVRQDRDALLSGDVEPRAGPRTLARFSVRPGGTLTFVPHAPGCRFNPPTLSIAWHETLHRLMFRVLADPDLEGFAQGGATAGRIDVFAGPLLIGELPFVTTFGATRADPRGEIDWVAADSWLRVFPACAEEDADINRRLEAAAVDLDLPFLDQILAQRRGEWSREVLKPIEASERFQLFWSAAGAASPDLRKEWEFARALGRADFIRGFYCRHPQPAPPAELPFVTFRHLALSLE